MTRSRGSGGQTSRGAKREFLTPEGLGAAPSPSTARRGGFDPRLVTAGTCRGAIAQPLVFSGLIGGTAGRDLTSPGGSGAGATIYLLNALSFLAVIFALVTMRTSGAPEPTAGKVQMGSALAEGLRFVFKTPLMVWTMGLDFLATFFSGATSLLPIFADQVLHVGARLRDPVCRTRLGSLPSPLRRSTLPQRPAAFLWAVAAYGASTIVSAWPQLLAHARGAPGSVCRRDLDGHRQTIRQFITPDRLRGRMTSINMIFFMGGPQLGELEAGLVASLFASTVAGVTFSVVSGGILTVVITAAIAAAAPMIRRYDFQQTERPT